MFVIGLIYVAWGVRFMWKVKDKGKPDVKVYKWTGKNDYVALCEPDYISFGGGCVFSLHLATPLFRALSRIHPKHTLLSRCL